ncbi:MATE family efflux transporter [Thermodesulfobacteriota bacterium]
MLRLRAGFQEVRPFIADAWDLGWPMILIMFFHFAIGLTDVYVAGYLGTEVLAAVGYVGQLYFTLIILANAITVGTVSMVSQAYGAGSSEGVGSITSHSVLAGLGFAGILTVVTGLFPGALVRLAGMPSEIQEIARAFIQIFSLALIPSYLTIITGGILRASDRVRITMRNAFVAAVINVFGDVVLAFGWGPIPELGYRGIAWASAGATTVGMILNLAHVFRGSGGFSIDVLFNPVFRCLKSLIKLGGPSALQQVAWNTGTLVVYFLVGRLKEGEVTALAAMTGGLRIEAIIFLPIFALNMAAAVLTGNRLGVGDVSGARSGAKATALLSLLIIIGPAVAMFIYAPLLSRMLTDDPGVLFEMTRYLRINMACMPFLAVGVALGGALQGAGDTLATMRIIFTGMWLVRIPAILISVHVLNLGALGVWCCMTLSIIVLCILMMNRFLGDAWTTASVDKKNNTMLWEACLKKPD